MPASHRLTRKQYTHMSIPGDYERGLPTTWVVFDQHSMRAVENCGEDMQEARDKAHQLNRAKEFVVLAHSLA